MGECGGSSGVNYRLYLANQKYNMIEDCYHIFEDCSFFGRETTYLQERLLLNINDKKESKIKSFFKRNSFIVYLFKVIKERKARIWIKAVGDKFQFRAEDKYLFHDVDSAYAFLKVYNYPNSYLVYHQQGGLYSEWKAFSGDNSKILRGYFDILLKYTLKEIRGLFFPSKGAEEVFLEDEPEFKELVTMKSGCILYNGFSICDKEKKYSKKIEDIFNGIGNCKIFTTIASLNYAKGVERIPQYLSKVKEEDIPFKWIVLGDGSRASSLEKEISMYDLWDNTIWIREYIEHDDVLAILSRSDFYIMFHRWSIFDYSTIEAMSLGAIPILTPVGGNKEVIDDKEQIGLFVYDFSDISGLRNVMENYEIIKSNCINFEKEKFSEKRFLERYKVVLEG